MIDKLASQNTPQKSGKLLKKPLNFLRNLDRFFNDVPSLLSQQQAPRYAPKRTETNNLQEIMEKWEFLRKPKSNV